MKPKSKTSVKPDSNTLTKTEILRRRNALETQEQNQRMAFLQDHFKQYEKNLKTLQIECKKLGHDWVRQVTLNNHGYVCSNCKFIKEPEEVR